MDKNREKLLVLGHVWPQPNATAAGEHMTHLLECFGQMGYAIHFASAAQKPEGFQFFSEFNIQQHKITINDDQFNVLLKEIAPAIVLFDRFMVEEQFSWRVRNICPNAIRVLDTEDLHFVRKEREQHYKGKKTKGISDIAKRELASIYRSDMSLIISKVELNFLVKDYNIPSSILCYFPLLSDGALDSIRCFQERKDLFFIGNFLHEPNWQTVLRLKKNIWPLLQQKLPNVELHIYGSHAQQKHLQLTNTKERFHVKGYIEDVTTPFSEYRLLVAPIPFGAGQKGKFLKAMEHQLPFVTSSVGAEAMFLDDIVTTIVIDDDIEFIEGVAKLYKDELKWNVIKDRLAPILKHHFDKECYFKILGGEINNISENLEKHRQKNIVGQLFWHHSMRSTEYMSRWIMEKNKRN